MSVLTKLFDNFTRRTTQEIAAAKLAADVAMRKRLVGDAYAKRREAALKGRSA